jgi:hypothetical protein
MEFVGNAVAAVHVAGKPSDVERLAAIIALEQRDRRRRRLALLDQPAVAAPAGFRYLGR